MSICLICVKKTGLWAKAIDPWLLLSNESEVDRFTGAIRAAMLVKIFDESTSLSCPTVSSLIYLVPLFFVPLISAYWPSLFRRPTFISSSLSQMASFVARVSAIYFASVDESVMVAYFFEYQLIRLPFSIKMKPDVDFLVV